jgi:hypothetical protein
MAEGAYPRGAVSAGLEARSSVCTTRGSPDRFAFGPIYLPTESNPSQPAYWLSKRGPILVAAVGNLTTTELGRVLYGVLVDP